MGGSIDGAVGGMDMAIGEPQEGRAVKDNPVSAGMTQSKRAKRRWGLSKYNSPQRHNEHKEDTEFGLLCVRCAFVVNPNDAILRYLRSRARADADRRTV
jgi:hypothetical protein